MLEKFVEKPDIDNLTFGRFYYENIDEEVNGKKKWILDEEKLSNIGIDVLSINYNTENYNIIAEYTKNKLLKGIMNSNLSIVSNYFPVLPDVFSAFFFVITLNSIRFYLDTLAIENQPPKILCLDNGQFNSSDNYSRFRFFSGIDMNNTFTNIELDTEELLSNERISTKILSKIVSNISVDYNGKLVVLKDNRLEDLDDDNLNLPLQEEINVLGLFSENCLPVLTYNIFNDYLNLLKIDPNMCYIDTKDGIIRTTSFTIELLRLVNKIMMLYFNYDKRKNNIKTFLDGFNYYNLFIEESDYTDIKYRTGLNKEYDDEYIKEEIDGFQQITQVNRYKINISRGKFKGIFEEYFMCINNTKLCNKDYTYIDKNGTEIKVKIGTDAYFMAKYSVNAKNWGNYKIVLNNEYQSIFTIRTLKKFIKRYLKPHWEKISVYIKEDNQYIVKDAKYVLEQNETKDLGKYLETISQMIYYRKKANLDMKLVRGTILTHAAMNEKYEMFLVEEYLELYQKNTFDRSNRKIVKILYKNVPNMIEYINEDKQKIEKQSKTFKNKGNKKLSKRIKENKFIQELVGNVDVQETMGDTENPFENLDIENMFVDTTRRQLFEKNGKFYLYDPKNRTVYLLALTRQNMRI